MKSSASPPQAHLQRALRTNAMFSMISGISFLVAASFFATLVGIGASQFQLLGINLLVFAAALFGLSRDSMLKKTWALWAAGAVILMDFLWVLGSLVLSQLPSLTTDTGKLLVLGISVIVGVFGLWQTYGVIQIRKYRKQNAGQHGTSASASISIALLLVLPALTGCGPADLRPDMLQGDVVSQSLIDKGLALRERVVTAHGYDAWQTFDTQEVIATDVWQVPGFWSTDIQRFSLKSVLGTFTAQVNLLDGPEKGEILGTQAWQGYHVDTKGNLSLEPPTEEDTAQNFYIPSLQYFNELPFRLLKADRVAYAGEREYRDQMYDLLFVTWGSFDVSSAIDQYVLWINRETGLVSMTHYTVRDAGAIFTGTIHFEDYRDVQGIQFPFRHTVILPAPENTLYPLDKYFFHQTRVESTAFDGFDRAALIVDSTLAAPADVKR